MVKDILYVYTDASYCLQTHKNCGVVAFSVWNSGDECLVRDSMVSCGYYNSNCYELVAIKKAFERIKDNYPENRVILVTDSDTAQKYILHNKKLTKEPYRTLADDIRAFEMLEKIICIKSHTKSNKKHYLRNADVDALARNFLNNGTKTEYLRRQQRELDDDTELLKPVDARKLVKRYYVEKQKHENKLNERPAQIKTNVHSGMNPVEKFSERFSRFLQKN